MPKHGQKSVNISISSSAAGLKEELEEIARKRAMKLGRIVAQIYIYAVDNRKDFPNQIDQPRPKPGKHISSDVPTCVAEKLTKWAHEVERSRAHHCCFILECVINDGELRDRIFP